MNNNLRISYSSVSCFKTCPEKHYLQYILGAKSPEEGASLSFGIAIDEAIGMLLRAKRDNILIPTIEQVQSEFEFNQVKGWEQYYDDPKLRYTKNDVDSKVFSKEDWEMISLFEKELHCSAEDSKKAFNKKSFKKMTSEEDRMYSRLGWLSLRAKGKLMIAAFCKEILPEIEKVMEVQYKFEGEISGHVLIGYLDLIAKLKGYEKPIVIDLKTAAMEYEFDSVMLSEQLRMYLAFAGNTLDTHLAGFLVLLKGISTETFCKTCGNKKETNHKTCNATINGKRCNSEWTEVPKARTQKLIDEISEDKLEDFKKDLGSVVSIMESGLRYKNFGSCKDYHSLCPFYFLCHKGDAESVLWKDETSKQKYLTNK